MSCRLRWKTTGKASFGLNTLEELDLLGSVRLTRRVAALQGGLILDSRPGKGSSVRIRIPQ
jgi:signal transduction histidine kinase